MECSYYQIAEIVSVRFFLAALALCHFVSHRFAHSLYGPISSDLFICPFTYKQRILFSVFRIDRIVPSDPPSHMEALLLNSSAVYLKWKAPALQAHNGKFLFPFASSSPHTYTLNGHMYSLNVISTSLCFSSVTFPLCCIYPSPPIFCFAYLRESLILRRNSISKTANLPR